MSLNVQEKFKQNVNLVTCHVFFLFKALFSSIFAHTFLIFCSYGDRCPKSDPAKAFAIVWLLSRVVFLSLLMGEISATLTVMVMQTEAGGPMGGGNKVTTRINDNLNVIKITHHNTIQIEFGNVKPKSTKYYE